MELKNIDPKVLLEGLREGVVVHSATTEILYANPVALQILRLTEAQILGKNALDPSWRFIDGHGQLMTHQEYPVNRVLSEGKNVLNLEVGVCDSSTEDVTWALCNAHPYRSENGEIEYIVVSFTDITNQKSGISFESVVKHANDIVVITEAAPIAGSGPRIVYVNDAFTTLTGYSMDEVKGLSPRILQGEDTCNNTRKRIRDGLQSQAPVHERIKNYSKSGQPYWLDLKIFPLRNAQGYTSHFAAVERDITELVAQENKMKDLAAKDALTCLLNRRAFYQEAEHFLSKADLNRKAVLALIDIDFFKRINDTFGHEYGDNTLCRVAEKLASAFGENTLLCRYGGVDFAVLFMGDDLKAYYEELESFRTMISQSPMEVAGRGTLTMTVSIGISRVKAGGSLDQAVKSAEKALVEAKKTGRNKVELQIG